MLYDFMCVTNIMLGTLFAHIPQQTASNLSAVEDFSLSCDVVMKMTFHKSLTSFKWTFFCRNNHFLSQELDANSKRSAKVQIEHMLSI